MIIVLNRLERTYIDSRVRYTDFEIISAGKHNPTTLTLRAVSHIKAYDPKPALSWSIQQISAISKGEEPDQKVTAEIADDLVELAKKESEFGYKAFWINGHTEAVQFDEDFVKNAEKVARSRRYFDSTSKWHVGKSRGSVVGELKAVDDIEGERQFVVVPPAGGPPIRCTFPDTMRADMGAYLFQTVRVAGLLHYEANSPFPVRVDAIERGIQSLTSVPRRRTLRQMRGVFEGMPRKNFDMSWISDA